MDSYIWRYRNPWLSFGEFLQLNNRIMTIWSIYTTHPAEQTPWIREKIDKFLLENCINEVKMSTWGATKMLGGDTRWNISRDERNSQGVKKNCCKLPKWSWLLSKVRIQNTGYRYACLRRWPRHMHMDNKYTIRYVCILRKKLIEILPEKLKWSLRIDPVVEVAIGHYRASWLAIALPQTFD